MGPTDGLKRGTREREMAIKTEEDVGLTGAGVKRESRLHIYD